MFNKAPLSIKVALLYLSVFAIIIGQATANEAITLAETEHAKMQVIENTLERNLEEYKTVSGVPVHLKIPSVNIDINVDPGGFTKETGWILTNSAVHYVQTSAPANNREGRTVIYGHNVWGILAGTRGLKPGAEMFITLKDGQVLKYIYVKDTEVIPTDLALLNEQVAEPEINLITCSGDWSEKRRIMDFKFIEVVE